MSITETELKNIESVIGRLNYSVYPTEILDWLKNFKEEEIPHALSLLRNFEYISSDELLFRLDHLLKELFSRKPKPTRFTFIPFGKYGKSSTLVSYLLSHTHRFKERKKYLNFEKDLTKLFQDDTVVDNIVFFDDFVGSGNTFLKYYRKLEHLIHSNNYLDKTYLICPVCMEEAYEKISNEFPYIKIITEKRVQYLSSNISPLKIKRNSDSISNLIDKYGNIIEVDRPPKEFQPRGYDNSESMISFFYGTPNNTFPIIWGDKKWSPLYPRFSRSRLKKHIIRKKDILYLLNTFFDSDLNVLEATSYISDNEDSRKKENQTKHKNNYLLFAVIYMIYQSQFNKEFNNLFICNYLGITRENLRIVYVEGKRKGYINNKYELTEKAMRIMKQLNNKRNKDSLRKITEENLKINNFVFLPKSFRGNS